MRKLSGTMSLDSETLPANGKFGYCQLPALSFNHQLAFQNKKNKKSPFQRPPKKGAQKMGMTISEATLVGRPNVRNEHWAQVALYFAP